MYSTIVLVLQSTRSRFRLRVEQIRCSSRRYLVQADSTIASELYTAHTRGRLNPCSELRDVLSMAQGLHFGFGFGILILRLGLGEDNVRGPMGPLPNMGPDTVRGLTGPGDLALGVETPN